MKKRLLAGCLATVLAIGTFVGCSNAEQTEVSRSNDGAAVTKESGETSVGEPYKLTMAYVGNEQPDMPLVLEKINELTRAELNIEVNIVQLGFGDFREKLKLMLTGNDPLDVFPIFYTEANAYINNGQIIDMTDLTKQHGQDILEALGENAKIGTVNGFLYGFPVQKESGSPKVFVMRKDLVEKYKVDITKINSLQDMTAVFEAIQPNEPNMNMIVGFENIDKLETTDKLYDHFGVLLDGGQNTEVVNWFESEEFIDKANLMREWYTKGYVMSDAATTTEAENNLMKAGNTFCYISPIKPGFLVQEEKATGYELVTAPINEGVLMSSGINFFNWGIAQNSENPEKAMEFLNFAYSNADFMNLINWGIEGTHYKFVDEEKTVIDFVDGVDAKNTTYNLNIGWELPNQYLCHVWNGNPADIWEQTQAENDKAIKSKALGFIADLSGFANELTALSNVKNQYIKAINTGSVDPNVVIPEFNKALYAAGLQTIIDEKQSQLDAWLETNK